LVTSTAWPIIFGVRWPYDKRADPIHAWGAIAAGIAIAGVLYAARALNPHTAKSWLWPTNWMIIPVIVTGVGPDLAAPPGPAISS
jgi:hypothetical protein